MGFLCGLLGLGLVVYFLILCAEIAFILIALGLVVVLLYNFGAYIAFGWTVCVVAVIVAKSFDARDQDICRLNPRVKPSRKFSPRWTATPQNSEDPANRPASEGATRTLSHPPAPASEMLLQSIQFDDVDENPPFEHRAVTTPEVTSALSDLTRARSWRWNVNFNNVPLPPRGHSDVWNEGWNACFDPETLRKDNPHDSAIPEFQEWDSGYLAAMIVVYGEAK